MALCLCPTWDTTQFHCEGLALQGLCMPLSDHLPPATKEQIWKETYVDVFELLYGKLDNRNLEKEDKKC